MRAISIFASLCLCFFFLISVMWNTESHGDTLCTVTVHSLPSGATVYFEEGILSDTLRTEPTEVGKTPLQLKLSRDKHYIVWLKMDLADYRELTKSIPTIQKHLDEFERGQKYGGDMLRDLSSFFENYTGFITEFTKIGDIYNRIVGVSIPHELSTDSPQKRICGVFIPEGMNPDELLPLVKERNIYWWNKEGFWAAMRSHDAPDDLIERSYSLLLHAGTALLIYPMKAEDDEIPQEMVIHVTMPPLGTPDNIAAVEFSTRPASWTYLMSIIEKEEKQKKVKTPVRSITAIQGEKLVDSEVEKIMQGAVLFEVFSEEFLVYQCKDGTLERKKVTIGPVLWETATYEVISDTYKVISKDFLASKYKQGILDHVEVLSWGYGYKTDRHSNYAYVSSDGKIKLSEKVELDKFDEKRIPLNNWHIDSDSIMRICEKVGYYSGGYFNLRMWQVNGVPTPLWTVPYTLQGEFKDFYINATNGQVTHMSTEEILKQSLGEDWEDILKQLRDQK